MKVFISWSGSTSHQVALALHDWLPAVIQAIEPYVSSEDIDKGARWNTDISQELEHSGYGILCITAENIAAPWVNFEAGALSKSLERSRVAPFLFGIQRTDVTGPLLQFQSTVYEREDVHKLVRSLNKACGDTGLGVLDESRLDEIFGVWWPMLEKKLNDIKDTAPSVVGAERPTQDVLAEVLELVRGQQKMLSDPSTFLPPDYVAFVMERHGRISVSRSAIEDLARAWIRLDRYLELEITRDEEKNDLPEELLKRIDMVRAPLEYILRRPGALTREFLSRRQASLSEESE